MGDDTQWPSEDEDFDAVTDAKSLKTASAPQRKSVAVTSNDEQAAADDDSDSQEHEETHDADADHTEDTSDGFVADETPEPDTKAAINGNKPAEAAVTSMTATGSAPTAHQDLEESEVSPEIAAAAAQLAKEEDASVADISLPAEPAQKSSMGRLFLEIILVMALAGVGYWALSLSSENKDLSATNKSLKTQVAQLNANPQIIIQKQTDELISKVGALMQLPKGETPTVANVSDAAAAKKQSAFFNNAQNGDRVLMYVKAGEAILYRPSTDKIILVAPLTFSGAANSTTTATKAKP